MKTNLLVFCIIGLSLVFVSQSKAQNKVVRGIVTTFDSICVIGAEVQVKSTRQVVKTDSLGRFSASVNPSDKLKVMARGFITEKVKLEANTKLVAVNLKLKLGEKSREYAIGYGYVKDSEKLNALAQMTNKDVNFAQFSSMSELIRGRFAGVQVQSNGDIIIRGINSINSSSSALIVVDGIVVDSSVLSSLSPTHVKSINVIKDGSAAIYGSRGANGVLLIETRRGKDD